MIASFTITSCSTEATDNDTATIEKVTTLNSIKSIEIEILDLINAHRVSIGLTSLIQNEQIRTQTNSHTQYMINNSSASHDNFFNRKSYLIAHANAEKVSENVAYGYTKAESVVSAWLRSDGHKLNIEGNHTHFSISAEQDENGRWYFTNIFVKATN